MTPNPILPGFHPDPSIVAVDGTYYLVTSSFEYYPGLPVYRSTDLVSWELVGAVGTVGFSGFRYRGTDAVPDPQEIPA